MPTLKNAVPKYRKHKATGQAVVTLQGRVHYLGPWKSKASKIEYDRLIGQWLAAGRPTTAEKGQTDLTILELAARYWKFVRVNYVKNGQPTSEQASIANALRRVKVLYGHTPAVEFGPLALKTVRQRAIQENLARSNVNGMMGRIRRMFKWAAAEELIPAGVPQALSMVTGLRRGRCEARETKPVLPVDEATFEAMLPHLPEVVTDMVRFQRLTGCRPAEVCIVRPCDVDTSIDVWEYRPESHKTKHHGRERVIFLGPKAQNVHRPYLLRAADAFCFSPQESEKKRRAELYENRQTPLSCGNRPGTNRKRRPKRTAGERYDASSYRRAIHRAVDKANAQRRAEAEKNGNGEIELIEKWSPNRLRHAAATEIRRRFGLEAAQVTLGHAAADVTQVYAERDFSKAADVMRQNRLE